jgi:hypothetical protein
MRSDHVLLKVAASDMVTLALGAFTRWLEERVTTEVTVDDDAEHRAARLLGVEIHADADEIRAALRSKIVADAIHPDHGGDGAEAAALIAAQNLLLARARERSASRSVAS